MGNSENLQSEAIQPQGIETGYDFSGRILRPWLGDITATGAAVIVNSIGSQASFRNPIARSILNAAGAGIRDEVHRHKPIRSGQIVVTHAANLSTTHYLFHAVVTGSESSYYASPKLIAQVSLRCVKIADLLFQPTLAMPAFGTGMGRAKKEEAVKQILNAIIQTLPDCETLKTIIFATTSEETFALFNNQALTDLALARREHELRQALPNIPPKLYGLVGDILFRMEEARKSGQAPGALQEEAQGLVRMAEELARKLPDGQAAAGVVQLIIATGNSIIQNVSQMTL
jgi:O-acetyl-ADP-ribose deacetylase (regulator of RNase III)